jgi:ATP-dependent RNA helicase DHX29
MWVVQGGRGQAQAYARKQMLSWQTLEMLREMRMQFASMLADINFMTAPSGMSKRGQTARWADDPKAPWNKHASQPAIVRPPCTPLGPPIKADSELTTQIPQ